MPSFTKSLVSCSLILLYFPTISRSQIVEVEPGRVRAPFVRVYRTPDGVTRVRAPFVDVFTNGSRHRRPWRGLHGVPRSQSIDGYAPITSNATDSPAEIDLAEPDLAEADLAEADWRSLKSIVLTGEAELENQLERYRDADRWKNQLHVGSLRQILTVESNQPPVDNTRDQLQVILNAYNHASEDTAFRTIRRLIEFHTVHRALRELLLSPVERQRGRLVAASLDLDKALARVQNGPVWADYLRLPESVLSPHDAVAVSQPTDLSEILDRFEFINADSRYRVIAAMPAFQVTLRHLADYISLVNQRALPPIEVLPPPGRP